MGTENFQGEREWPIVLPQESHKEKPEKALSVVTLAQFPGNSKSRSQTGKSGSPNGVRKWRKER